MKILIGGFSMAITVKSEMIVPAAGKPCYEQRNQYYLDADGLRRRYHLL